MRLARILQIVPVAAAALIAMALLDLRPPASHAAEPRTVAFLGVYFQNDNEMYEPTTDAERNRIATVERIFKTALVESGKFRFVEIGPDLKARIAKGQAPGECGGCEIEYGKELGADQIAWINIQKVSNLILNLNVYMFDVEANKMSFVRSVDIRGNTDESWERSLKYLLKNYLLPEGR